ncbi:hypothetical protein [Limnofasciculus baicalensis]|uniref:Uncharacterized protein n=1 Tax=Limnofasciculus baicalensis BBK-W-15 TaxID=2699891 RepID=A0AAE3GP73_9CYAN|nr:hypothetical protein [Limnofasciculus baicalensis]MCP2727461.1 hypothetical protein [Limnofasciculus baicalensis BBK-W-15]
MKFNAKVLLAILTVTAGGVSLAPAAFAGEGGIAGAASFNLRGGAVTDAAVAAAIGKNAAYAGANNNHGHIDAFAVGTGGRIVVDGDSNYVTIISEESSTGLEKKQANTLTNLTLDINSTSPLVDIQP